MNRAGVLCLTPGHNSALFRALIRRRNSAPAGVPFAENAHKSARGEDPGANVLYCGC